MRKISEFPSEKLRGARVLVRSGLNVAVENGRVIDPFRVRRAAETISYLTERGARVVVISHVGREAHETLAPVARELNAHVKIAFVPELFGPAAISLANALQPGEAMLLENLRSDPGETSNDAAFVRQLAGYGEIFVQDAFEAVHREHASVIGVPSLLPSFAGLVLADELKHLAVALQPPHPALCILGGAKFETKGPLIEKFLNVYDTVFVGGALSNDIYKARGLAIGRSLTSDTLPSRDVVTHARLMAPLDVTVQTLDGHVRVADDETIRPDEKVVDIGPASLKLLAPAIRDARFILWNGPMGLYEGGFTEWTDRLAALVAESSAQSIVGGGDTIAAITNSELEAKFTFISTGGGAMLEYLLKGTLPGIEALG